MGQVKTVVYCFDPLWPRWKVQLFILLTIPRPSKTKTKTWAPDGSMEWWWFLTFYDEGMSGRGREQEEQVKRRREEKEEKPHSFASIALLLSEMDFLVNLFGFLSEMLSQALLRKHCIAPLWNWGQNMSWNEKYPPTFTSCSCKGTTIKFTRDIYSRELFVKLNSVTVPRHAKWKTSKRRKRRKVQLHPAPRGLLWRIVDLLLRSMTALCLRRPRLPWAYPCALIWRVGKISKNDRPRHVLMCVKEHCNSCCL